MVLVDHDRLALGHGGPEGRLQETCSPIGLAAKPGHPCRVFLCSICARGQAELSESHSTAELINLQH